MKKILMRTLSAFLAMIMIVGMVPMSAFAENDTSTVESDNDLNISNTTSFGRILNNTLSSNNNNYDSGFSITSIDIVDKKATVEFNNADTCLLVVSIYDETNLQFLASGLTEINEISVGSASVDIEINSMPTYFVAYAFLLNSDYAPLCEKFETKHYTKAFEEFYSKTLQDFDPERTIVIEDNNEKEDFAVLNSNVECIDNNPATTMEYDANDNSYTFENATDSIKSLSSGDMFYYQYGEDYSDFIITKIKTIDIDGSNVIITEDENVGISDFFDYINIEAEGDYSQVSVDEENLDDCYTLLDEGITTQDIDYNTKESFSVSVGVEHNEKSSNGKLSGKISGTLGLTLSVTARVYYDPVLFGKDYYECKVTTSVDIGFTVIVEGKISAFAGKRIPIPYIPVGGIFDFEINITPDISFSVNGTFTGMVKIITVVSYDSVNKLNKSQTTDTKIDPDISGTVEFKFGARIEFKIALYAPPHAKKLKLKNYVELWSVSVSGAGGLKISGSTQNIEPKHPCKPCIAGTIRLYAEIGGNLKVCLVPKVIDFNLNVKAWADEWYLTDFYFSLWASPVFKMARGVVCPNKYHDVNVIVTDSNGAPLENVLVFADNCICDREGDKKYDDKSINTNSEGKATICLKKGKHKIKATYNGVTKEKSVDVLEITKTVSFEFDASTNVTKPVTTKPTTTKPVSQPNNPNGVYYKYNASNTTLTIYGKGDMDDYTGLGKAPWNSYRDKIEHIVIESGVTSLGNYAFAQCMNLETVTIGDTVTDIGMLAFYQCDALQSVRLPDSVKTVGDYSFYGCYMMTTLTLGSVETIGDYAFGQCTAIKNVVVPQTTTSIGDSAFGWCQGMKTIEIKNKNCTVYDSPNTIFVDTAITAPAGSKAQAYANKYGRTFSSLSAQSVVDTTNLYDSLSVTYSSCVAGNDYILLNVTGYGNNFKLSTTNLEFIDQLTADANGSVSSNFIPRKFVSGSTTLLIGDFGNGTEAKKVTPKLITTSVEIDNNPGTLTINYMEGVKLYAAVINPVDGCELQWYVNGTAYSTGDTLVIEHIKSDVKITVKLVDVNGNPVLKEGKEISAEEMITVKAGFFQKLIAFFKFTLFGQVVLKTN